MVVGDGARLRADWGFFLQRGEGEALFIFILFYWRRVMLQLLRYWEVFAAWGGGEVRVLGGQRRW